MRTERKASPVLFNFRHTLQRLHEEAPDTYVLSKRVSNNFCESTADLNEIHSQRAVFRLSFSKGSSRRNKIHNCDFQSYETRASINYKINPTVTLENLLKIRIKFKLMTCQNKKKDWP